MPGSHCVRRVPERDASDGACASHPLRPLPRARFDRIIRPADRASLEGIRSVSPEQEINPSSLRERSIRWLKPLVTVGLSAAVLFVLALLIRIDRHRVPHQVRPPVILISIASLNQAESLSPKSMPALSGLSIYSMVFSRASTCTPNELGSIATLLTGTYPDAHRVGFSPDAKLPQSIPTLAEMFRDRGFATAAYVGSDQLAPSTDLSRGFDRFDVFGPPFTNRQRGLGAYGRTALETVSLALQWLDQQKGRPAFLFLQLNDAAPDQPIAREACAGFLQNYLRHLPRLTASKDPPSRKLLTEMLAEKPGGLTAADLNALRSLYRNAVGYTDRALNTLFIGLKKRGLFDGATIVVCGDRGEPLAARNVHAVDSLLQDSVSIPLIMKLPKSRKAAQRTPMLAQNVDVAPTLVELCNLAPRNPPQGISLLAVARREKPLRDTAYYVTPGGVRGFRRAAHKLIVAGKRVEMYDLGIDPDEQHDLVSNPLHVKLFAKPWVAKGNAAEGLRQMNEVRRQVLMAWQSLQTDLGKFVRSITPREIAALAP